jgi:hypothetical protein
MSTAPITKEENTAFIKDIPGIIETLNRESMEMIKEGILKELGETQLYKDPTGTLCFLQKDVDTAIEKGYNDQVAKLHEIIKDMTGAENILVFIENTNRESMMMIKNGILNAIEALKDNDKLYKDSTDPSKLYFLKTDINIAIEEGYTIQVAAYEELRKYTIAGTTKSNTKEIDRIVDKARTTPLPSNAPLNNAPLNIETLHNMTEDIWKRARETPLPVSNSNTNNNSGYHTNNNNSKNTPKNNRVQKINLSNKRFHNPSYDPKKKPTRKRVQSSRVRTFLPLPPSNNES